MREDSYWSRNTCERLWAPTRNSSTRTCKPQRSNKRTHFPLSKVTQLQLRQPPQLMSFKRSKDRRLRRLALGTSRTMVHLQTTGSGRIQTRAWQLLHLSRFTRRYTWNQRSANQARAGIHKGQCPEPPFQQVRHRKSHVNSNNLKTLQLNRLKPTQSHSNQMHLGERSLVWTSTLWIKSIRSSSIASIASWCPIRLSLLSQCLLLVVHHRSLSQAGVGMSMQTQSTPTGVQICLISTATVKITLLIVLYLKAQCHHIRTNRDQTPETTSRTVGSICQAKSLRKGRNLAKARFLNKITPK